VQVLEQLLERAQSMFVENNPVSSILIAFVFCCMLETEQPKRSELE